MRAPTGAVRHRATIWIDHAEARIFHANQHEAHESRVVVTSKHPFARHPSAETKRFFEEVAASIKHSEEVLLVGPSAAKLDFFRHVGEHDHRLEPRIVGIESVDAPTDPQLDAYTRQYFGAPSAVR